MTDLTLHTSDLTLHVPSEDHTLATGLGENNHLDLFADDPKVLVVPPPVAAIVPGSCPPTSEPATPTRCTECGMHLADPLHAAFCTVG
jgi:hypothetical protein